MASSNKNQAGGYGSFSQAKLLRDAGSKSAENAKFLKRLSKKNPDVVDDAFNKAHERVFAQIDCLDCGNCCRTLGPRITGADIRRIARVLRISETAFAEKYLRTDEDNDFVFRQMPCPFLGTDNYCSIYGNHPRACREYPHTDRRRMQQVFGITLKNTFTCPAVLLMLEQLKAMEL